MISLKILTTSATWIQSAPQEKQDILQWLIWDVRPDITILSKLNHTNELYTPVPKDRNQPTWDVLEEPHGPNSSSQKIKKEKYQHLYTLKAMMQTFMTTCQCKAN